jgi:hypothetical protein
LISGDADLVIGSRFVQRSGYDMGLSRSIGRRFLVALGRAFGLVITDPTSGYQAMNAAVLDVFIRDLFPTDFPDLDVLLSVRRHGLTIVERPVVMAPPSRRSSLHHGMAPLYYFYRLILALWADSGRDWRHWR